MATPVDRLEPSDHAERKDDGLDRGEGDQLWDGTAEPEARTIVGAGDVTDLRLLVCDERS